MSSEDKTAEKEKTEAEEEKEEEPPKDLAATAEDREAAAPPAVREVPAHLKRQSVRKPVPVRIVLARVNLFPALFIAFICADTRGV